jgi:hypothetical protein
VVPVKWSSVGLVVPERVTETKILVHLGHFGDDLTKLAMAGNTEHGRGVVDQAGCQIQDCSGRCLGEERSGPVRGGDLWYLVFGVEMGFVHNALAWMQEV